MLFLVVNKVGGLQCNSRQRSLSNGKRRRGRALIVAHASGSHLSSASIHVVLKVQGIVGAHLHQGLAILHHHIGHERLTRIDGRRDLGKHAIGQRLGCDDQLAPVGIAKVVIALGNSGTNGHLASALDGHLASGSINSGNLGLVRRERQHAVATGVGFQCEVSIAIGLLDLRRIEQHQTLGLDHLKLYLLLASIVIADALEGGGASAGISVAHEGHGIVLVLHQNGLAVLHLDIRIQSVTCVNSIVHRDGNVLVGQHLLVLHCKLGLGALHLEGVGLGASHGILRNKGQVNIL